MDNAASAEIITSEMESSVSREVSFYSRNCCRQDTNLSISEDPQRITGGFEGLVNGQEVEKTELHTFITTGGMEWKGVQEV